MSTLKFFTPTVFPSTWRACYCVSALAPSVSGQLFGHKLSMWLFDTEHRAAALFWAGPGVSGASSLELIVTRKKQGRVCEVSVGLPLSG